MRGIRANELMGLGDEGIQAYGQTGKDNSGLYAYMPMGPYAHDRARLPVCLYTRARGAL